MCRTLQSLIIATPLMLLLMGSSSRVEINWRSNYDSAREEARKESKPLFVVFR